MIDASFLIIKKHIKSNCKNLLINFFALFLSLFALIVTTNAILLKDEFNNSIINSYPNKDVYKISKIGSLDFDNDYNIVQKTRPTIEEVLSIDSLKINYIDIDLSYLLDTYTLKVDGLIKNESIIFEPNFLNDDIFITKN